MDTKGASILLIEDHRDIAEMIYLYLEQQGYVPDHAGDGVTGLHLAVTNDYDAIVLDVMLPGMDGIELCKQVRKTAKKDTPIIMLTARDTLDDKLTGLDVGADDYLVKPFEMKELEARVKSLVRRYRGKLGSQSLRVADLEFDPELHTARRAGQRLALAPIGLKILTTLMRASPGVVSRQQLEREVWGDIVPDSDALRSHMYNLRKVVDKPFDEPLIHTIQATGYRLAKLDD